MIIVHKELIQDLTRHERAPVSSPKVGRQFTELRLDAADFAKLAELTPEQLHDWLRYWQCGFVPGK